MTPRGTNTLSPGDEWYDAFDSTRSIREEPSAFTKGVWSVKYADGTVRTYSYAAGLFQCDEDCGWLYSSEDYLTDNRQKGPVQIPSDLAGNTPSTGEQTGSGKTDLNMVLRNTAEPEKVDNPDFDETQPESDANPRQIDNPLYNPDQDGDGLGDNLQFTVPSAINYVVNGDGERRRRHVLAERPHRTRRVELGEVPFLGKRGVDRHGTLVGLRLDRLR